MVLSAQRPARMRAGVTALLMFVAILTGASPVSGAGDLRVTFVAFGQGDAIVYEGPCGELGLVDAGAGSKEEVLAVLDGYGSRALEWISVSHYDADHLGDVLDVAQSSGVAIGTVYDRGGDRDVKDSDTYRAYYDWLAEPSAPTRDGVDIGDVFTLCEGAEQVTFTVVSVGSDGTATGGTPVTEENDRGVCVHVEYGQFDLASCGDVNGTDEGSRSNVEAAVAPVYGDVEVAKVNHHGSPYSSSLAYVQTLSAQVAVVQVGRNSYGHPAQSVLQRWAATGDVLQTMSSGGDVLAGDIEVTATSDSGFVVTSSGDSGSTAYWHDEADPRAPQPGDGFDGDPTTTERVDATAPTSAAVLISQTRFDADSADHVVLSRSDLFADALAGAPLTAGGPLLFAAGDGQLDSATRTELDRVLPSGGRVYLLGGQSALPEPAGLRDAGYELHRLAGPSRVETALVVADEVRRLFSADTNEVALARAYAPQENPTAAWADSVTGGAWAAGQAALGRSVPILVTPSEELHPAVKAWLDKDQPSVTVLFGGTAALSANVEQAVPSPQRVAGPSRHDTAVAISESLWVVDEDSADREFVVIDGYRGDGWAFGLAAAGIAADRLVPLLTIPSAPASVPESVLTLAGNCTVPAVDVLLIGSAQIISTAQADELDAADGRDCATPSPSPSPDPSTAAVEIASVLANPDGDDVQPESGEYVELRNTGASNIDVSGWYLLDAADHRLDIGQGYTIPAGGALRVYTGPGANTATRYYNGNGSAVLNNDGDTVRLHSAAGDVLDTFTY